MKYNWKIIADQDDIPVRGNAIVSGDDAYDKKVEDEILERLDVGDIWAWASVTVECEIEVDGEKFVGREYLGACSYKDEEDFKVGGYYEQMMASSREDLIDNLDGAVKRGYLAAQLIEGERKVCNNGR